MTEWDSTDWRAARDAKMMEWIGDRDAVACILMISNVAEAWDDVFDQDHKPDIDTAMVSLMVTLPMNPFWSKCQQWFQPLLVLCINAWLDARDMEAGTRDDKVQAFVLRNLGIELVQQAVFVLHGFARMREVSRDVRRFFEHESFFEWEQTRVNR